MSQRVVAEGKPRYGYNLDCVLVNAVLLPLQGDRSFDVNDAAVQKDKEILDRARTAYKAADKTKSALAFDEPLFIYHVLT